MLLLVPEVPQAGHEAQVLGPETPASRSWFASCVGVIVAWLPRHGRPRDDQVTSVARRASAARRRTPPASTSCASASCASTSTPTPITPTPSGTNRISMTG